MVFWNLCNIMQLSKSNIMQLMSVLENGFPPIYFCLNHLFQQTTLGYISVNDTAVHLRTTKVTIWLDERNNILKELILRKIIKARKIGEFYLTLSLHRLLDECSSSSSIQINPKKFCFG